ncbi:hypothetical protein O6H91_Y228400 [Diphasiastrum complanatum]|nr:hypothetical protein O6H91_Y228400 [Diphasiastrum complanatum]
MAFRCLLTYLACCRGDFGRLGHGNSSDLFVPQPIKALQELQIKQIACGDSHCLAITGDGEVFSWGRNQNGQLGLGNTEDSLLPQKILAFEVSKSFFAIVLVASVLFMSWLSGQSPDLMFIDFMSVYCPFGNSVSHISFYYLPDLLLLPLLVFR